MGDLVQRHCVEIWCKDPAKEVSYRDLANRALLEILCRDLASRPLIERSCAHNLWREQGSCSEIFYRELERRSYFEISCRDLSSTPRRNTITKGYCTAASTKNLSLGTIFYRDLHKGNLKNLTWHLFFQRPPWLNPMHYNPVHLSRHNPNYIHIVWGLLPGQLGGGASGWFLFDIDLWCPHLRENSGLAALRWPGACWGENSGSSSGWSFCSHRSEEGTGTKEEQNAR